LRLFAAIAAQTGAISKNHKFKKAVNTTSQCDSNIESKLRTAKHSLISPNLNQSAAVDCNISVISRAKSNKKIAVANVNLNILKEPDSKLNHKGI